MYDARRQATGRCAARQAASPPIRPASLSENPNPQESAIQVASPIFSRYARGRCFVIFGGINSSSRYFLNCSLFFGENCCYQSFRWKYETQRKFWLEFMLDNLYTASVH
jgi:hypothetical protein